MTDVPINPQKNVNGYPSSITDDGDVAPSLVGIPASLWEQCSLIQDEFYDENPQDPFVQNRPNLSTLLQQTLQIAQQTMKIVSPTDPHYGGLTLGLAPGSADLANIPADGTAYWVANINGTYVMAQVPVACSPTLDQPTYYQFLAYASQFVAQQQNSNPPSNNNSNSNA
ncbi:hypothetical protein [Alicyclobacillus vulcanalis]|uniref:Uncharacterized protein n=1 Tax=Alicyclobacillus vulcanalis TaxID=252246 RepID=A0A1N7MQ37_9BACL|nr:hypothetical protein [Alicyclobacillus vulcanalis]SIS88172.1 hypothetical protein SAMN05421799_10620 [Alicyclobacillus vulcanalis]